MSQRGFSLLELLFVILMLSVIMVLVAMFALPAVGREAARGAVHDVQTFMQLARIESITRNRECRFVIDSGSRALRVMDTMGTAGDLTDDVELRTMTLPSTVGFARPDSGSAITLESVSGNEYQTIFDSDGSVATGTGEVVIFGGGHHTKIEVFGAGGLEVLHWDAGGWRAGA